MELNFKQHLPVAFSDDSRVWIYQSNRMFSPGEIQEIDVMLTDFVQNWQSHGAPVKGFAKIFYKQFIIVMADETLVGVGGCSTDSSVRVMKAIEEKFSVDLFDRQSLSFLVGEKVLQIHLDQLNAAMAENLITEDSLYFDNTVLSKKQLEESWITPLKQSWLKKKLQLTN